MKWLIKHFDELTTLELFEIYKVRTDVFVVEQKCPYPEVDDFDKVSYHVALLEEGKIVSYCRVLPPNTTYEDASIGRVLSIIRHKGYATQVVKKGIEIVKNKFETSVITIEAQVYASDLYRKIGFVQTSDDFLEDGIPHIQMKLDV